MKLSRKLILAVTAAFLFASCENGLAGLLNESLDGFNKPESFSPKTKGKIDVSNLGFLVTDNTLQVFSVNGTSGIPDFPSYDKTPWAKDDYSAVNIDNSINSVGNCAFGDSTGRNAGKISSVTINGEVTRIGDYAFNGSSQLKEIDLPDSLREIGTSAFGETGLDSVEIPASVSEIGKGAFKNSKSLQSVSFNESFNELRINSEAFCGCNSLAQLTVKGSSGETEIVESDSSQLPNSLKSLGDQAFYGTAINKVDLPVTVLKSVGEKVFSENTCATIPDSGKSSQYVEELKKKGFKDVEVIETDDKFGDVNENVSWVYDSKNEILEISGTGAIPSYYHEDGQRSPWWNINVSIILISNGITSIGQNAFNWDAEANSCSSALESVEIASTVTLIEDCAFANNGNLNYVHFNSGLKTIGSGAFIYTGINDVEIPDTVIYIGDEAFNSSTTLNLGWKEEDSSGHTIVNSDQYSLLKYVPKERKDIVFQSKVDNGIQHWAADIQIGDYTDKNVSYSSGDYLEITCSGVSSARVNEVTFDMYKNAANGPYYGTRLNGDSNSTFIGLYTLYQGAEFTWTVLVKCDVDGTTDSSGICMDYGFGTANGWDYEYGWSSNEFDNQLTLRNFNIDVKVYKEDPVYWTIQQDEATGQNVLYIGCQSVALPYFNTAKFGDDGAEGADAPWTNLDFDSIVFTDTIQVITNAFYLTGNGSERTVSSIHLPDNLRVLGINSFWSTKSTKTLEIPSNVIYIGWNSFGKWWDCCQYLKWPSYLNEERTLTGLLNATDKGSWCNQINNVCYFVNFNGVNTTLYLLSDSFMDYTDWNQDRYILQKLVTGVYFDDSVTHIPDNAFYGFSFLDDVYLPSSITSIGNYAFYATDVNELTLGENVTYVGLLAFNDGAIITVDWAPNDPDYVIERMHTVNEYTVNYLRDPVVDYSAGQNITWSVVNNKLKFTGSGPMYDYCSTEGGYSTPVETPWAEESYSVIEIEDGITSIGSYAFNGASVSSVTIPSSVQKIDSYAFYSCYYLTELQFDYGSCCTEIETGAFYSTSINSVSLPSSVRTLGNQAFTSDCEVILVWKESQIDDTFNFGSGNNLVYASADLNEKYTFENGVLTLTGDVNGYFFDDKNFVKNEVTSILVDSGVKTIYAGSFSNCENLTSFKMVENRDTYSLEEIGDEAFYNCGSLETVALPETLKTIGQRAFSNCYSLSQIDFPEGITSIKDYAFYNCSCSNFRILNLYGCSNLTSISKYAFAECASIEDITLPRSIEIIDEGAFNNCTSLKNLSLQDGLKTINDYAFTASSLISSYSIPATVVKITDNAFFSGKELSVGWTSTETGHSISTNYIIKYAVPSGCYEYSTNGGPSLTFNGNIKDIEYMHYDDVEVSSIKKVYITGNVTSIGDYAFKEFTSLENVEIPSSVKSIGEEAFFNLSNLSSIYLPEGLEKIGYLAFGGTGITELTLPSTVNCVGSYIAPQGTILNINSRKGEQVIEGLEDEVGYYSAINYKHFDFNSTSGELAVYDVQELGSDFLSSIGLQPADIKHVVVAGVEQIGQSAFSGYSNLAGVSFSGELKKIYDGAFSGTKITSVSIPSSVTYIGDGAFPSGTKLNLGWGRNDTGHQIVESGNSNYTFTYISATGYDYVASESKLYISGIETVTAEGITGAFSSANKNTTVFSAVIEEGVKVIDSSAFNGWKKMSAVSLPSTLTSIGDSAFLNCASLSSIELSNTQITSIGTKAFSGCTGLTSFSLPRNITAISEEMLYGCSNISSISIPTSVTEIEQKAFYQCEKLETVDFNQTTSLTKINTSAFYGTGLKSITIPGSVTYFGQAALSTCKNLESVVFENGDSPIKFYGTTFFGCEKLSSVKLPDNISSLATLAFQRCSAPNLEIYFPSSLNTSDTSVIAGNTFSNCTSDVLIKANWNSKDTKITSSQLASNCAVMCLDSDVLVIHYLNNGSTDPVKKYYASTNDSESLLSPAEIEGKTFLGWYKEPTFNTKVASVSELLAAGTTQTGGATEGGTANVTTVPSVNLYALWAENYDITSGTTVTGELTENCKMKLYYLKNVNPTDNLLITMHDTEYDETIAGSTPKMLYYCGSNRITASSQFTADDFMAMPTEGANYQNTITASIENGEQWVIAFLLDANIGATSGEFTFRFGN